MVKGFCGCFVPVCLNHYGAPVLHIGLGALLLFSSNGALVLLIGLGALVLHDPCTLACFWQQKLMLHFFIGTSVPLFGIDSPTLVLLFGIGAATLVLL